MNINYVDLIVAPALAAAAFTFLWTHTEWLAEYLRLLGLGRWAGVDEWVAQEGAKARERAAVAQAAVPREPCTGDCAEKREARRRRREEQRVAQAVVSLPAPRREGYVAFLARRHPGFVARLVSCPWCVGAWATLACSAAHGAGGYALATYAPAMLAYCALKGAVRW